MISSKKLNKSAKKWQKPAASKRKKISLPRTTGVVEAESYSTSSMAEKGHFVVYTADKRHFVMVDDEFVLLSGGPIKLPCDAVFMEYVVSLIQRHATKDLENALLMSLATGRCLPTLNLYQEQSNHQSLLSSF